MATEATAGSDFFSTMTDFSLVELSAHCGHSVRNLRAYMQLGVLHQGARSGRETRYDETHIARLDLVSRYRERGYSLAAIADLLAEDQLPQIDDVPLAKDIIDSWLRSASTYTTIAELDVAFPEISSHPDLVAAAIDRGLASLSGTDLTVHCPDALALGVELLSQGIALDVALDELDNLGEHLKPIIEHTRHLQSLMMSAGADEAVVDAEILPRHIIRLSSMLTRRFRQAQHPDLDQAQHPDLDQAQHPDLDQAQHPDIDLTADGATA